jgi:hypothetical protein
MPCLLLLGGVLSPAGDSRYGVGCRGDVVEGGALSTAT